MQEKIHFTCGHTKLAMQTFFVLVAIVQPFADNKSL